jgi:predicted component of type VI protein secretion system
MEVDIGDIGDLMELRRRRSVAFLRGTNGHAAEYPLEKVNFSLGRSRECDVRCPGWFAPRIAARIQRRHDGFYLLPSARGRVRLNAEPVSDPVRLQDNDLLEVRGTALRFIFRPPDDA